MTTLRLESGVCISSDNPSVIQQYLKYGAVELKDTPETEKKTATKKKPVAQK